MRTTAIHHMLLASASVLLAACSSDSVGERVNAPRASAPRATSSEMMVLNASEDPSPATVERLARTVASVETADGGSVQFLDLGDDIAVSEVAAAKRPFVAQQLLTRENATPLELFLAIGGSAAEVPEALTRHHRAIRGTASAPRAFLRDRVGVLDVTTPGVEPFFSCSASWYNAWKTPFIPLTKYQAASVWHPRYSAVTFYPGSNVFYGKNTNSKTYLGACNGNDDGFTRNVGVAIHRKISGAWVTVHSLTLTENTKYTFYSGIPAYYRGRAEPLNTFTYYMGVGAAWTISPGLTS